MYHKKIVHSTTIFQGFLRLFLTISVNETIIFLTKLTPLICSLRKIVFLEFQTVSNCLSQLSYFFLVAFGIAINLIFFVIHFCSN